MIPIATLHAQRHRLAELSALRRELTTEEIDELLWLDELERRRAANRRYRADNAERCRQRTAEWRRNNPERCKQQHAAWRQTRKELYGVAR